MPIVACEGQRGGHAEEQGHQDSADRTETYLMLRGGADSVNAEPPIPRP